MDPELNRFLRALESANGAARRKDLPSADRKQDRARQKAKQLGYAYFEFGTWFLKDAGREALASMKAA